MTDQKLELDDTQLELPHLISRESECDRRFDTYKEEEMVNRSEDTSKLKALPELDFGVKKYAKVVTFEDDKKVRENPEVADLAVFKLPKLHLSAGSNTGLQTGEEIGENPHLNKDEFYTSDIRGDTGNHHSKTDEAKNLNESFPRLLKNYEFQRDLRYTQCSQKLSRIKYSYFQRFPSPPPLNKRERLKMELEKMKPKKKEKALEPGSLRTREEYTKIFISLKKVQKMFVEKHHLSCRPLANSPFFMD